MPAPARSCTTAARRPPTLPADFNVGGQSGGTGTYLLSSGKLTVGSAGNGDAVIGDGPGSGTFQQTGGTAVFSAGLTVASLFAGSGNFIVSGGTNTISGDTVIADGGVGAYTQSGGTATFDGKLTIANNFTASGTFALTGGSAVVKGEIDVGVGATTSGEFDFNAGGGSATLAGANATGPNFKIGIGGTGTLNDGGGQLKAANVAIGTENGGSGLVNISGAGAAFSMTTLSVGSFQSGSSTTGGVGNLVVSDGGYVSVAKTLTLNDYASADTNLKETFSGGISLNGGSLEIGGNKGGLAANTLQIDSGGLLSGHGVIAGGNNFNVTISKGGKIEAKDGLVVISGNVSGSGTIQIDNGATVEIVGLELDKNLNVTFQSGGTGKLILDSPRAFQGRITGLTDGDQIVLTSTGSATLPRQNEVVAATIRSSSKAGQSLLVAAGTDVTHLNYSFVVPVSGPTADPVLTGQANEKPHYFTVTSGGSGASNYTTLTLSSGSPIAQAMGLSQSGGLGGQFLTGAGIKIGIISDSFNVLGGEQADINNGLLPSKSNIIDLTSNAHLTSATLGGNAPDEGRAMAEIVHAIAPGATIVFQSPFAEPQNGINNQAAFAQAVQDLQAQHVQIIVDDLAYPGEPSIGGVINTAIDKAIRAGISYFTAAGNFRVPTKNPQGQTIIPALKIFGHQANHLADSVAAANWLGISNPPSLLNPYLQQVTEPFSSVGVNNSKPDLVGPDGGPTSVAFLTSLDPFFGTSAAAPAVAAVAALMDEANPQLDSNPLRIDNFLNFTAISDGEAGNVQGFGFINAPSAINKALLSQQYFFDPLSSAGPTLLTAAISQPFGSVATARWCSSSSRSTTRWSSPARRLSRSMTAAWRSTTPRRRNRPTRR